LILLAEHSHRWWLWPNLLSLDAPAVAVVWQSFLARAEGVAVPILATVTLGLAVWGVYLSDRLLDIRRNPQQDTDRHRFTARNQRIIVLLASIALIGAAITAAFGLPSAYLKVGGVVAIISMGYFAAVHILARQVNFNGLKETIVGAVFAAGVAIPLIVGTSRTSQEWVSGALAFGGLCAVNCILISRWEEARSSAPSGWVALAASGIAVGAAFGARSPVTAAVLASLGLLIGLALLQARVSTRGLRVLADAALLTPVVVAVLT
jgi:hypothetical protein